MQVLIEYAWPGNVRELENVIERLLVTAPDDVVTPRDLPLELQAPRNLLAAAEARAAPHRRRRSVQAADRERESFWTAVYPLYMQREITRGNVRDLVRKGLEKARGNYKIVARSCSTWSSSDYKRFLNFLRKHDCQLPFKEYR